MKLQEQINEDLKQAMRGKLQVKLNTLRLLKAALTKFEKEKKVTGLNDEDVFIIIRRELKLRHETLSFLTQASTVDQSGIYKEIETLEAYLPAQMGIEQLKVVVKATIDEHGFSSKKDMGHCIKIVKEKVGAAADGKAISDLVKQHLP